MTANEVDEVNTLSANSWGSLFGYGNLPKEE